MPEPRPISEKQFMLDSSRKVVSFLQEKGYEEQITVKSLQSPPIKVYANIMEFCMRQMDPHFTFKGQYDEEIPALFRMLEYPIAVQKAELKVISQHQWPRLLAALTWLVDLLQYEETRETLVAEEAVLDTEDSEAVFFDYLSSSYRMFMDGSDDTSDVDQRFAAQFEEKNKQMEEECAQLERANSTLQKDILRLEEQAARLPALRKEKHTKQVDVGKFNDLVAEFDEYIAKIQRKLSKNEKDLAAKKKRLEALLKEKETLQARLDAQESSGIDYRKMVQDRLDLEEQVAQLRAARDMATKIRGEHEIALNKLLEVVDQELRHYNELAMRLRLLPASANTKMPEVSFDLQFKSHARAEDMVTGDMHGTIKPALKSLRASLAQANRDAAMQALQLREDLDRLQEQAEARRDDVVNLTSKCASQESALRAMKEVVEEDQKQLRIAAKNVREETEALVKLGLQRLQNSHHIVDKLRVEENRLKAKFAMQSQEINNNIIDVIDRLTNHKQYIQLRLKELLDHAENTTKEVQSMDAVVARSAVMNKSTIQA